MGENKNEAESNKKEDDAGKMKNNNKDVEKTTFVTVVLKVKMDCEGCVARIVKCVRGFEGVETVKAEMAANKLTVTGVVDPAKLREKLQGKSKKEVELISPTPTKKDKENAKNNNDNDKSMPKNSVDKKSDNEKKPKEPPVTTAVLKMKFHCQGCIHKIHKTVNKTKGVLEISTEKQSDFVVVTVKGTADDVKKLTANLTEKFKRPVELVQPAKKEKEKDKGKDNEDDECGKKKKAGGGGGGQEATTGGGGEGNKGDGVNKLEYMAGQPGYGYGCVYPYQFPYGPYGPPIQAHPPQIFSDENPNACAVM